MDQPITAAEARKLAKEIIENGNVMFVFHAEERMAEHNLSAVDVVNVLRGGAYTEAEWENGAWRHHAFTQRIEVVIEFENESELTVITAWRKS